MKSSGVVIFAVLFSLIATAFAPLAAADDWDPYYNEDEYTAFYTPPNPLPPGQPGDLVGAGYGADKGGSAAQMQLSAHLEAAADSAEGAGCVLVGAATVSVSGKLAQFGNRLLGPVADAMLDQFAGNFRAAAAAVAAAPAAAGSTDAAVSAIAAAPAAPMPAKELNALALAWIVFKRWIAGLFGKR